MYAIFTALACARATGGTCHRALASHHILHRNVQTIRLHAQWPSAARTHRCGDVDDGCLGIRVVLGGWMLAPRRVSRHLAFIPLIDQSGVVQLKLDDSRSDLCDVPVESVVEVHGTVARRAPGAENPNMRTGQVEVTVDSWRVLNAAGKLPFYPTQCVDEHTLVRLF